MATITNPDGTVSEFKIGQDDTDTTPSVKLNKDGTPRKKRGPAKKFNFDRKTISAMVAVPDYNDLVNAFGSPTDAINGLINLWRTKGNK